jgi:hypothetical protein
MAQAYHYFSGLLGEVGPKSLLVHRSLALALDFHTWRSLERGGGSSRKEAVETMLEAVRSSVSRQGIP